MMGADLADSTEVLKKRRLQKRIGIEFDTDLMVTAMFSFKFPRVVVVHLVFSCPSTIGSLRCFLFSHFFFFFDGWQKVIFSSTYYTITR
jgi:hypothetical protein